MNIAIRCTRHVCDHSLALFFDSARLSDSGRAPGRNPCPSASAPGPSTLDPFSQGAPRKPPSQTWRTFLANHTKDLVSSDFSVVPTGFFRVLFVFVILSQDRRRPVHVAVTEYPTAEWAARQLLEAFPWDSAPHHLSRDRGGSYGERFREAAN
jgi:hypothetical protein